MSLKILLLIENHKYVDHILFSFKISIASSSPTFILSSNGNVRLSLLLNIVGSNSGKVIPMTCEAKNGLHQILLNHICFMVTLFVIFQMFVTHNDLEFDMLHLCECCKGSQ